LRKAGNVSSKSMGVCAAMLALVTSCNPKTRAPEQTEPMASNPAIYTTTYPLKYFVERIGRDNVGVNCPVPAEPEAFLSNMTPEIIEGYQKADIVVINGAGYEKWIEVACLKESRIVDTARPCKDVLIEMDAVTHSHGPGGDHTHKGIDGHIWLDPLYAGLQAREIASAMVARFPAHASDFEKGYSSLAEDLAGLDRLFSAATEQYDGRPMLASHPSYSYIARRYGWEVVNPKVGLDPKETPDERTWSKLRRVLAARPAGLILWESAPEAEVAEAVRRELGLRGVVFSPCMELSEEDVRAGLDYLGVMRRNAENMRKAFAPRP